MTPKDILIVEDDSAISLNYEIYCNFAIDELQNSKICEIGDINVLVANNLNQARHLFQSSNVFLISLDLNLNDTNTGKEVSGMVFLRELRERGENVMVLVASNEGNSSNIVEALQKLKATGYFLKSELEPEIYQKSIEAALFYQNTFELLATYDRTGNPASIQSAQESLKRARQAAESVNINYGNFPEDLEVKIAEKYNKLDKFTELPANESVEEAVRRHAIGKKDWTIIKAEFLNLESIVPAQINLLLKQMGKRLHALPGRFGYKDAFVGSYHIQYRPILVVVIFHNAKKDYPEIVKWVSQGFEEDAQIFTDDLALKQIGEKSGFEARPKLTLKAWHGDTTEFFDLHQAINELGSM